MGGERRQWLKNPQRLVNEWRRRTIEVKKSFADAFSQLEKREGKRRKRRKSRKRSKRRRNEATDDVDDVVDVAIESCQLRNSVDVVAAPAQSHLFNDAIEVDPCNN